MSDGAAQMVEQNAEEGRAAIGVTRSGRSPPSAALQLGWRVAELYALVNDPGKSSGDTLLPGHASLGPEDQLQLQLRSAAGDASRAGIESKGDELERLLPDARKAPSRPTPPRSFGRRSVSAMSRSARICGRATRPRERHMSSATACRTPTAWSASPTGPATKT